jgi:RNA polymerase sigma-70 factor (ECF subfamily)
VPQPTRATSKAKSEPNVGVAAPYIVEHNLSISTHPDTRSLVNAARSGDGEAFARLVGPNLPAALVVASLIAGSSADGSDAVQDALVAAWRGLRSLRDPAAFPSWFRKLTVRSAMKTAGRRRHIRIAEFSLDEPGADAGHDPLDRALELRALDRAFDRLEPKDRTILALRHAGDLTTQSIAEVLSVPEGTVKSRVHSAMQRLRAAYEAEDRR